MLSGQALSVSELTERVKALLEGGFPAVSVEGEISNWRPASSGHVYFTLKDSGASLQAVMFKGRASRLPFKPRDGDLVVASGNLGVYAARGQYQLVVEGMEIAGAGAILAMLEERKRRLAAEGLFDAARKRPIPAFPRRVAVVTSPTGAALRDILSVMRRRNAAIRITVLPASVQGTEAPSTIVRMIEIANAFRLGDVIIVGRGGGSLEDLLAFSDESVARAVAASEIPVISAVGHETDWSLCDLAADLRAPTPSAAAELVSHSAEAASDRIDAARAAMTLSLRSRVERTRLLVESFSTENLEFRLDRALQPARQRFDDAKESLVRGMRDAIVTTRHREREARMILAASDPMSILARGFAVVRKAKGGCAIRDASDLRVGEALSITFHEGGVAAEITEVIK